MILIRILYRTLPSQDLSSIKHVWDHLGLKLRQPGNLAEQQVHLQELWNNIKEDTFQDLYITIFIHILFCIHARSVHRN